MPLDCVITVPAGLGNGAPKAPMTDKVSRFIKDSESYYTAVLKHLKECEVCDPVEALVGYIKNRDNKNKFGRTSGLLVKLAYRYKRAFGDRIPEELVHTFLERSLETNWTGFIHMSAKDKAVGFHNVRRAVDFEVKIWRDEIVHRTDFLKKVGKEIIAGKEPRLSTAVNPQPLFHLCYQLTRSDDRERTEENARFYDDAKAEVVRQSMRDWSKDHDPAVRKAVKLTRIVRGSRRDGTILALPGERREETFLTDSGYLEDEDDDVRDLARALVVLSVMDG